MRPMPFASNQGTRIHYETVGHGRPLVLHHGFTETLESWNRKGFVAALKAHYALILLDSRGHGSSDKPHAPESYGLRNGAMDVVCVLDALRVERAHYCGYSLGGWIGFGLARHAPERLLSLVVGGAQPYGQSLAVYRGMLQEDLQTCLSHLERAAGGPLPAPLRDAFFQNDIHALRAAYAKDREDISDGLPRITLPCLLFSGEADPLAPEIQRCAAEISDARFVGVPELNHVQMGLQLRRILPHLTRFLSSLTTEGRENEKPKA